MTPTGTSWRPIKVTSDNAYIGTLWIGYYKMISCANTVLEQLERIDKEKFTDADLVRLSQMKEKLCFERLGTPTVSSVLGGISLQGDGDKRCTCSFTGSIDSGYAKYRT